MTGVRPPTDEERLGHAVACSLLAKINKHMWNSGCGTVTCTKCLLSALCHDHLSVDVGVGQVTGEHRYLCLQHGEFMVLDDGSLLFQDEEPLPMKKLEALNCKHQISDLGTVVINTKITIT